MPLWYHPPPVLVEEGGPAASRGDPVNPSLYYHPPPVCVDPSEGVVFPPGRTAPPTGGVTSAHASAYPSISSPNDFSSPTGVAPSDGLVGVPPPPPMIPGMYPAPYQGDISVYPKGGYGRFHTAENPNFNMVSQPIGFGSLAVGYSAQPPEGPHTAVSNIPMDLTPGPSHNDFPGSLRFDTAGAAAPRRSKERVCCYDDETKKAHIADPYTSTRRRVQAGQFGPPSHSPLLHTNSPCQGGPYYVNENNGHKITTAPNPPTQRKSRHLELTREDSGEFEVKLWHGDGDHTCEKKVRVASGPSGDDHVDINLRECQHCDSHGYEKNFDGVERQRLHGPVVDVKEMEALAKQLEEHKLKKKIRREEYAKMKVDEKLKLEIRKELEREDAQRQEVARIQKLQAEKRIEVMKAESRVAAEIERERIRKGIDIELKRRNEAHIAELEAEKERRLHMEHMIQEETRQREFAIEMDKRRKNIASIEEEKRKSLEDKVREEARQQELTIQAERERICHGVSAELEKREKAHLAEIDAEKKRKEGEERLKEEARNLGFAIEVEKRRIANLAELMVEDKRKMEQQKRAEEEAHQRELDQEHRRRMEDVRKRAEEDRIRSEEWERVRAEEIQRMREEIRKELTNGEAQRIKDENIKYENLRIQQMEADRIKLDERVRAQVEAGREELKRELRKELEKEEEDRALRLQASEAALRIKAEAEALTKEQARIRSFAEAQENKRVHDHISYEKAIMKQRCEHEAKIRKQVQAQAIALEQETAKKRLEDEAARAAAMATAIVEENEMRRIIRAEIKEDMRKSCVRDEMMNKSLPHRERVKLHWEVDCGKGFE